MRIKRSSEIDVSWEAPHQKTCGICDCRTDELRRASLGSCPWRTDIARCCQHNARRGTSAGDSRRGESRHTRLRRADRGAALVFQAHTGSDFGRSVHRCSFRGNAMQRSAGQRAVCIRSTFRAAIDIGASGKVMRVRSSFGTSMAAQQSQWLPGVLHGMEVLSSHRVIRPFLQLDGQSRGFPSKAGEAVRNQGSINLPVTALMAA